ncbi:MmgE/PrpD family protein [Haloferax sp. MBLA0076]|uniref:MmgE/PrpD family protein n=1 Tax=Haloferax litoreum TaxID=2666140 RepID=A0A6A8GMF1_9EURY|nr:MULTISPECIES: MmgE/PrpD family protein [Haloferax]KAB1190028.1 MmgE/PrpD family protein [Haloferax sp. CBA1148]MRX23802.1 MmgE/PrpD family protein [Haloferax litoreum]
MNEATLASFVSTLDRGDIPDGVAARGSLVIADTIGVILGGASDPAVSSLTRRWAAQNGGQATILGTAGERTSAYRAAFVNATAGTVLELDEGHRFAAGHPAIHVLPALLADGESSYRSGDELLTAFVAGYEVAVRVAEMVVPLADGVHPHGVWGGVGTAAAVARLRELDAETTLDAMRIAANYAQHTRFEAATEGATVRNSYAGMSNLSGLVAVEQAEAGFTGLEDGIALHLASVASGEPNRDALADELGVRWEIERGYFKVHAACRYTHAVLDAVETLTETEELDAADVETVGVETYPAAASLSNTRPKNALQAKFSIPFAVASSLVTGDTGKLAFTDEALTEETLALAKRVEVTATEEFASRAPDERGARVTIKTVDGDTYTHAVRAARGGEHEPFSDDTLQTKFEHLVTPVIGDESIDGLWTAAREPAAPRVLCALTRA